MQTVLGLVEAHTTVFPVICLEFLCLSASFSVFVPLLSPGQLLEVLTLVSMCVPASNALSILSFTVDLGANC